MDNCLLSSSYLWQPQHVQCIVQFDCVIWSAGTLSLLDTGFWAYLSPFSNLLIVGFFGAKIMGVVMLSYICYLIFWMECWHCFPPWWLPEWPVNKIYGALIQPWLGNIASLQKYYVTRKFRRIKQNRKAGFDPIKTAFEEMKARTWQFFYFTALM